MSYLNISLDKISVPLISAGSIIMGSLIGGLCSWITTKYSINKSIENEKKIVEYDRLYDCKEKTSKICENINIIRLDVCNALFQSIRILKYLNDDNLNKYPICINKEYSKSIASLIEMFNLKEMSYIYQLYGVMEILNRHVNHYYYEDRNQVIKNYCELFLMKLYGENYMHVLDFDIEEVTYEELYKNDFIKEGYKNILTKLDEIKDIEGYQKCRK